MKNDMERCQIVYNVLKTQIQFGACRCGHPLPTMEQSADNFLVSLDTVRSAYLRLQREGYITLSTNVGSVVVRDYSESEIEENVQRFYSERKHALIDMSKSLHPLLGRAQWVGLKNAPPAIYDHTRQHISEHPLKPSSAFQFMIQAFDSLGNDLLLRLLWQIFTFYEAPFFSTPENPWGMFAVTEYAPRYLDSCLKKDWDSLQKSICDAQESLSPVLCRFYEERITVPVPPQQIPFTWSSYEKTSQICYTLAMDLLTQISRGHYPEHSLLPSLNKLSKERNVSVSTVRRALSLLNGIGAVKSEKRIGTRVLSYHETSENCDFTNSVVRKRLLDMARSMQILTLSCREVSELTIASLDAAGRQQCAAHLSTVGQRQLYELVTYDALEMLKLSAPYQTIRTVYGELLRQFFWGYALRNIWEKSGDRINRCRSCFEILMSSLEAGDAARFSEALEELMIHEFNFSIRNLVQLGIGEAQKLLIPELSIADSKLSRQPL
ncbi:GntR family transcriptional regulator [Enterocloster lavalensis]|uniref:GntR family transcriptional regulator n=1 Tax=Enterocloster lavalensis TaxID=460384 RepID=UPI0026668A13|nr:GntR family transcriptional regulator [Enterocloster lavalensis]